MRKLQLTRTELREILALVHDYNKASPPPDKEPVDLFGTLQAHVESSTTPPEYQALHDCLTKLSMQKMKELQAIMYLGRGDFGLEEFWRECDDLSMDEKIETEIDDVLSKAPLLRYLSDGFEMAEKGDLFEK
jgi:hypothetical protein